MIVLKISDSVIDLEPKAKITLNISNPIFDRDSIARVFSYPFKVPATPNNNVKLGFPNRLDVRNRPKKIPGAQLEIDGVLFENGVILVTGATEFEIELTFQNAQISLLDDLKEINIHEILETVSSVGGGPAAHWVFDLATPPNTYAINIGGNLYSYVGGASKAAVVSALSTQISTDFPGMTFTFPGQEQLKLESSQVDLHPVLIESLLGLTLVSVTTQGQQKLAQFLAHVDSVNTGTPTTHCFPSMLWYSFYKGGNPKYISWVNLWVDGSGYENTLQEDSNHWETTWVPFVLAVYILSKIADSVGLNGFDGDFYQSDDFQQLVVFNNRALDQVSENYSSEGIVKYLNHFRSTIDLNLHVPQMTAIDFLNALAGSLALYFDYEDNTILFKTKVAQIRRPVIDWTDKTEYGYNVDLNLVDGFEISYPDDGDEYSDPTQLQDYVVDGGERKIELPFSTLFQAESSTPLFITLKAPVLNMAGSSEAGGLGLNSYPFRLLFYRGLQPSSAGTDYPMGTYGTTDINDATIGTLSLALDSADGLYNQQFRDYIELLNAPVVKKLIRLGINDLVEVRTWRASRRKLFHKKGEFTGVIKSVRFQANADGPINVSTVEFAQV